MKIVQMIGDRIHWITEYTSLEETEGRYAPDIIFREVPDDAQENMFWDEETQTFVVPPIPKQPMPTISQSEQSMHLSDLKADMVIAGLIQDTFEASDEHIQTYLASRDEEDTGALAEIENTTEQRWKALFMRNMVSKYTLKKLVDADILTQEVVDEWIQERMDIYGV